MSSARTVCLGLVAGLFALSGCGGGSSSGTGASASGSTGSTSSGGGAGSSGQTVQSVHYLVSDPYPAGGVQPTYFVVTCDGTAAVDSTPALDASGEPYLYYSLATFSVGQHSCSVAAADATGVSNAAAVTFTL